MKTESLENQMAQLKAILAEMEKPDKTIDRMHELYLKGSELSKQINKELNSMMGEVKLFNNDMTEYASEDGDDE